MSMSMPPWGALPPPPTAQGMYGMPTNAAAYTTVQAPRRSFDYAQAPMPQYSQPLPPPPGLSGSIPVVKKKKMEWPQPVRDYVQRSFDPSNMIPDVAKADMESKLKQTISLATDNGSLTTTDWSSLPLPQQMIRSERVQAAWQQQSVLFQSSGNGYPQVPFVAESRKRKSGEVNLINEENDASSPPWRNTNNTNVLESRISQPAVVTVRSSKRQTLGDEAPLKSTSKFQKNLEKRQKRFDGGYVSTYRSPSPEPGSGPVVGRCEVLEKRYLRLTSAPNPDLVRPLHILKQTLDLLKKKWRKEGNYSYICDQFKSLRQDLTVQHIKDKFTVEVYEIHARIALEKADPGEYNQCQTQLRALYAQNLGGNPVEFKAYRILYFIHTCNRTALNDVLADLTIAEKEEAPIKHALNVRSALALGNYHRFFRLYLETPNMGAYLMDMFVVRERLAALSNICKSYKPGVTLRFITEELGFESDADAAQFICDYNGTELLEEKPDGIQFLTQKAGQIFETAKAAAFRKVDIKGQI